MNLSGPIESAEHKFKQILEEFFISVYDENSLSSHGIDHHRRVWKYAKELVILLAENNLINDQDIPLSLIIACYLHDIGMSVDPGIRHGHHSKDLCIEFLEKNHLSEKDFPGLLSSVENHDNKDYINSTGIYNLLTILSVADDLDAFGYTGIYRYSEIYLARKINPGDIGYMIKQNAAKRYENFAKSFEFSVLLLKKHKLRYYILDDFFNNYNLQVSGYKFGDNQPEGYCGIIEIINRSITDKNNIGNLTEQINKSTDPVIRWFLEGMIAESSI